MKTLTYWSSKNVLLARMAIAISLLTLLILSAIGGILLNLSEIEMDPVFWILLIYAIMLGVYFLYPSNEKIKRKIRLSDSYFMKWKIYDIFLVIAFCLLGWHFGNQLPEKMVSENSSIDLIISGIAFAPTIKVLHMENNTKAKKFRIKRFLDKVQTKVVSFLVKKFTNEESSSAFGAVIFFFSLLYSAAMFLLIFLSCNIACNGSPTLAIFVFVIGQVLCFVGLYSAILALKNKMDKKKGQDNDLQTNRRFSLITTSVIAVLQYLIIYIFSRF